MRLQVTSSDGRSYVCLFALALVLLGCGEEEGKVHAKKEELTGAYQTKFQKGIEELELRRDSSYVQSFVTNGTTSQHSGTWKVEDHFLGGTDVILVGAVVSEDAPPETVEKIGDRTLNVHRRSGKLALALNEVADWYFIRKD